MGTPEFPALGSHCAFDACRLNDFLPFTCDKCKKVFCLEHRAYSQHECPNANSGDSVVIICPLCAKSIRLQPNIDANELWNRHVSAGCDPSNFASATKKKKCPAKGCKENVTFSNKFLCKDCSKELCLKHRFGPDHQCPGKPTLPGMSSYFGESFMQNLQKSTSETLQYLQSPQTSSWFTGASTTTQQAPTVKKTATSTAISPNRGTAGSEDCPQCKARFSSVAELIRHAEISHLGSAGQGPRAPPSNPWNEESASEVCPNCGERFADVGAMVRHVEAKHLASSNSKCRVS